VTRLGEVSPFGASVYFGKNFEKDILELINMCLASIHFRQFF
jgi:hypothetical protein